MSLRKIDLAIRLRGSKRVEENRTVKGIGTVKNALTLKGEKQRKDAKATLCWQCVCLRAARDF